MTLDKNIRVGIVTSIVATTLFIYFLDPILNLFGRNFIRLASLLYSSYVDYLFEKVALCSTDNAAYFMFSLAMGLICGLCMGACTALVTAAIVKKMKKKELPPSPQSLFAKLSLRKIIVLALFSTIVINFLAILILWDEWFQFKTMTSFNQHMLAVAPHLDEQEEENLWSQWTQMRTRQDYDKIYAQLRAIADKHTIRLPENKVYSAYNF